MPKNSQNLVEEVKKCKRLKFDSLSLTDENPVDKEIQFLKKYIQIRCLWTQLNFI
jgi:hypothetical protein